jgi:hypothetical protein
MKPATATPTYQTMGYKTQELKEQLYDHFEIGKWQRKAELDAVADALENGINEDGDERQSSSIVCVASLPNDSRVMALFNTRVSLHGSVWSSEFLRLVICPTDQSAREMTAEMERVWEARS